MWRNVRAATLNATFQLLVIYRLQNIMELRLALSIFFIATFSIYYLNNKCQKEKISIKKKVFFLEEIPRTCIKNLDIIHNENIIKVWRNMLHPL